ncbi:MAG: hypothetical protein AMS21_09745, partial [Gemmatimonas sp. SG8_38_2]
MRRTVYLAVTLAVVAILAAATPISTAPNNPASELALLSATSRFHVQLGDLLTMNGKFDLARREYAAAANLTRAEGYLPVNELRRIANTYYFEQNYTNAMAVLEGFAREAGSLGEVEMQVWALADAAWIAGLADDQELMEGYLERVEVL